MVLVTSTARSRLGGQDAPTAGGLNGSAATAAVLAGRLLDEAAGAGAEIGDPVRCRI